MRKAGNITFVYPDRFKPVTGGHLYERDLIKTLKDCGDIDVEVIYQNGTRSVVKKMLSPTLNIGLYNRLKSSDLIVFNSTKGFYYIPLQFILRKFCRKSTLVIHHHFLYKEFTGIKRIFYKWMEKTFIKGATYVLTPSPYIYALLKSEYGIKPILNEIPFEKPEFHTKIKKVRNKLLYVGTIEPRKGLIYLCEALQIIKSEIPNYELHIVGKVKDQNYFNNLKSFVEENKLNVRFYGYVSDDELKELYSSAEVFVFPSLLEGFGMAINEAMAYGLPVIAFNNSAMPYSINEKNGILVNNKDIGALGSAIKRLLTNNVLRYNLSDGAIEWAQSLPNKEDFVEKTKNISSKILN